MSLLDTASLLLTPNAYKEGKLYSVIPSDGSGDFTFTRATTATRVNSDGLVELVPYNLLTYSEQFENAAWTKVNSTITANAETAPNGTLTADTFTDNSTSGSHVIARFTTLIIGTQTVSIYVKPNTLNKFYIGNSSTGNAVCFDLTTQTIEGYTNGTGNAWTNAIIEYVGNGWFRVSASLVATASGTFSIGFYKVFNATSFGAMSIYVGTGESAYLWGAQLVEGTNALPYQKTETRLNIPRLDYSLGGCPNILLEPQRTNLALQSSSFDSATWTKSNTTIVANNTISPSGVQDADLIYPTTTGSTRFTFQSASGASATYTLSVYAKAQNKSVVWLYVNSSGSYGSVFFDLASGTLQVVAGSVSTPIGKIEYLDNGWYKCSITPSSAFTLSNAGIGVADTLGNFTVSNNGTDGIYLWGAQLEAGAYATSYIGPTTTASVTRNLETVVKTGATALIGQTEGTIYLEASFLANDLTARYFTLSDGTNTKRIIFATTTTSNQIRMQVVDTTNQAEIFYTVADITAMNKIAIKYKANDFAFWVNGVQVGTDTSGSVPSGLNTIKFANADNAVPFYGKVKTFLLIAEALTNDQLAQLTTI